MVKPIFSLVRKGLFIYLEMLFGGGGGGGVTQLLILAHIGGGGLLSVQLMYRKRQMEETAEDKVNVHRGAIPPSPGQPFRARQGKSQESEDSHINGKS